MAQHSTVRQLIAEGAKTSSPITIFCLHGCQTIKEDRGADGMTDHSIHSHRKCFLFFFFKHAVLESFLIQVWISHSLMGVVEDWKKMEDCFDMYCWNQSHMRDLVLISFLYVKGS